MNNRLLGVDVGDLWQGTPFKLYPLYFLSFAPLTRYICGPILVSSYYTLIVGKLVLVINIAEILLTRH
jgi:hypothetical protein